VTEAIVVVKAARPIGSSSLVEVGINARKICYTLSTCFGGVLVPVAVVAFSLSERDLHCHMVRFSHGVEAVLESAYSCAER